MTTLERIMRGIVSCRSDGETPRELIVTELARPLLREQCRRPAAAKQDSLCGVPVRWILPRRHHPELAIRTMGGDTRVIQ
jgi:hypothetical protein